MIILLAIILVGGFIFLLLPLRFFKDQQSASLKIVKFPTEDIKAIIMLVGKSRRDEAFENLLTYKVLTHMSSGQNNITKQAWLVHGDISNEEGASYHNTYRLVQKFKSDSLKIHTSNIENIFDASEAFSIVNRIFASDNLRISSKDIVCDCTGGTKLMTLGMALACVGNRRLIYFPKGELEDASEYLEIDTNFF